MIIDEYLPKNLFYGIPQISCDGCIQYITVDVICPFSFTDIWYITIKNKNLNNGNSGDVLVNINEYSLKINNIEIDKTVEITGGYHSEANFNTTFDFYSFQLNNYPKLGDQLQIIIKNTTILSNIIINKETIATYKYNENSCYYEYELNTNSLLLDYCTFNEMVTDLNSIYYISIQPLDPYEYFSYNLQVEILSPKIINLSSNSNLHTTYALQANEINYYSISIDKNDDILFNATILNIQGGIVDFSIEYDALPFSCSTNSNCKNNEEFTNCCSNIVSTCELVIQPCFVIDGNYYLAVKPISFVYKNIPITYQISTNYNDKIEINSLKSNEFVSYSVAQSHYSFFQFVSSDFQDSSDVTLNIYLYIDTIDTIGEDIYLYVNYNNLAGTSGGCWENIAFCNIDLNKGSCSVQINPCIYSAYDTWYVSVFGGNTTIPPPTDKIIDFTLYSYLQAPILLENPGELINARINNKTIQHYKLDGDLLSKGSLITLFLSKITGGNVKVYLNYGNLAGPNNTCPICFNNTEYRISNSNNFIWNIANCNETINSNKNEIYFAISSNNDNHNDEISYSISFYVSDDNKDYLHTNLNQNQVLIDTIQPLSIKNYTINGDIDDSSAYLIVSLKQIENNYKETMEPLLLSIYNTTYLNCIYDSFSQSCSMNSNGFCSIVLQNCYFNQSDNSWIIQIINKNTKVIHFNIFYEIYSATPFNMNNNQEYTSLLHYQNQIDFFTYSSIGHDTLIIEVYFDQCLDIHGTSCTGSLYVSTNGPTGPGDCYENDFIQTNREKCVFAITSCILPSTVYYFSVSTTSEIYLNFPLTYTIKISEFSSISDTELNSPNSFQIYNNQIIYHSFSFINNPSEGSRLSIQVNNIENGKLLSNIAYSEPPSINNDNCECFEYTNQLNYDYCNIPISNQVLNWTIFNQVTQSKNNVKIGYTLTVLHYNQKPIQLQISTINNPHIIHDTIINNENPYKYYKIDSKIFNDYSSFQNILFDIEILDISGGSIEIYYSSENPPTKQCYSSYYQCESLTKQCFNQIQLCDEFPQYISIYAYEFQSFNDISYSIGIFNSLPEIIQVNNPSKPAQLNAGYSKIYFYNATNIIAGYNAPEVTFKINPLTFGIHNELILLDDILSYNISIHEENICFPPLKSTICNSNSCELSVSNCNLGSEFYFKVHNYNSSIIFTFSVTVSIIDISAIPFVVPLGSSKNSTISFGSFQTFATFVTNANQRNSLTCEITTNDRITTYFGFQKATPDCYEKTNSITAFDIIDINACCLKNGTYQIVIYASSSAIINISFYLKPILSNNNIIIPNDYLGIKNQTINQLQPLETQQFSFSLNETSIYPLLWIYIETNTPVNVYFERSNVAGPNIDPYSCITYSESKENVKQAFFEFLQCQETNTLANSFEGGDFAIGIQNPRPTSQNIQIINMNYGIQKFQPINITQTITQKAEKSLKYFYTYTQEYPSNTNQIQIELKTLNSTNKMKITLLGNKNKTQLCNNDEIITSNTTSTTNGECSLSFLPCSFSGTLIIVVDSFSNDCLFNLTLFYVDIYSSSNSIELFNNSKISSLFGNHNFKIHTDIISNPLQYLEFNILNFEGNPSELNVSYIIDTSNYPNHYPFCPKETPPILCNQNSQNISLYDCTIQFDPCLISLQSIYYIILTLANQEVYYDIEYNVKIQNIKLIEINSIEHGNINKNERITYYFDLNRNQLPIGSNIQIQLNTTCGDASFYISQSSLPGIECNQISDKNYYLISSCDLLTNSIYNEITSNDRFYLSIIGKTNKYQSKPIKYLLSLKIFGSEVFFHSIGPNQQIYFNGFNNIYNFPISYDITGQIEIELVSGGHGLSTLYFTSDEPTNCKISNEISVNSNINQNQMKYLFNSCELSHFHHLYFQFQTGSDTNSYFQITHFKPYIRDLDIYTEIPQYGAISSSSYSNTQIIDEEYYRLSLDPSINNFQFQAYIEIINNPDEEEINNVQIMSSQDKPPSLCNSQSESIVSGTSITWNWCEIKQTNEIYLTINNPSSSINKNNEIIPYSLYYSLTTNIPIKILSINQSLCDELSPNQWNYYSFELNSNPTSIYYIKIYSIHNILGEYDNNCYSLNSYLTFNGLATPTCTSLENTKTCYTSTCNNFKITECLWEFNCPTSSNISISVYNPNNNNHKNLQYSILWFSKDINPIQIPINIPYYHYYQEFNDDNLYFSFDLIPFDPSSQYFITHLISKNQDILFTMEYAMNHLPNTQCNENSCSNLGGCNLLINPCYTTQITSNDIGYIFISYEKNQQDQEEEQEEEISFTLNPFIYNITSRNIQLNEFVSSSLNTNINKPIDIQSFKLTITDEMISNSIYNDLLISIYGLNQPSFTIWISKDILGYFYYINNNNQINNNKNNICTLDQIIINENNYQENNYLIVDYCNLKAGDYYISTFLNLFHQYDHCSPVHFNFMVSIGNSKNYPIQSISSSKVYENYIPSSKQFFSFYSTNDFSSYDILEIIILISNDNNPLHSNNYFNSFIIESSSPFSSFLPSFNCLDEIITPVDYFWECSKIYENSFYLLIENNQEEEENEEANDFILPDLIFTIEINEFSFINITELISVEKQFLTSFSSSHFYLLSNHLYQQEAIDLNFDVLLGPSISIEIYSSIDSNDECFSDNNKNLLISSFICYYGHCDFPFSWANGNLFNSSYSFYILISGSYPSTYNFNIQSGKDEICFYPSIYNGFCDISWSIWDYHGGQFNVDNQVNYAENLYSKLVNSFCPPCSCSQISSACNESLIQYACAQSFRACDEFGFESSICEHTCVSVEQNCGLTFEQVNLPYLSCNHNFYYSDYDSICQDIYDISLSDSTNIVLWIGISFGALVLLILILFVLSFFIYKKFYSKSNPKEDIGSVKPEETQSLLHVQNK